MAIFLQKTIIKQQPLTETGFTLIEVLLALAVIAIALTALLKATAQDVNHSRQLKERMIGHYVATQAASAVQLGLFQVPNQQMVTKKTFLLNQSWYWRVTRKNVDVRFLEAYEVRVSQNKAGPYRSPLIFYKYPHE